MTALPPPAPENVTLGEIARRLDRNERENAAAFRDIKDQIGALQFVPMGTYAAERQAILDDIRDVRNAVNKIEEARAADRRLIWTSLVAPVLMILIGIVIAAAVTS